MRAASLPIAASSSAIASTLSRFKLTQRPRLLAEEERTLTRSPLIVQFGGFGKAAMIFACIYLLGFVAAPFLPETKGKPLPVDI